MITVTKSMEFCYSHQLPDHPGKCKNLHGHNSKVEFTFCCKDTDLDAQGMVIDFGDIKYLVKDLVERLDHQHLNDVVDDVYLPPTAENLCLFFRDEILDRVYAKSIDPPDFDLYSIRVYETPNNWAEWRRNVIGA